MDGHERELFIQMVETHLGVTFVGFQSGFGIREDMVLINSPRGSTLTIPFSVLSLPREDARRVVGDRIVASENQFREGDERNLERAKQADGHSKRA